MAYNFAKLEGDKDLAFYMYMDSQKKRNRAPLTLQMLGGHCGPHCSARALPPLLRGCCSLRAPGAQWPRGSGGSGAARVLPSRLH